MKEYCPPIWNSDLNFECKCGEILIHSDIGTSDVKCEKCGAVYIVEIKISEKESSDDQ